MIGPFPLPCNNKRIASAVAGAALSMSPTLSTLLVKQGLSPNVHFALAGVALHTFCSRGDYGSLLQEAAMSAGLGVAGAYLATMARGYAK